MSKQSKSKAAGELSDVEEKTRLAMPSTSAEHPSNTSATSESSPSPISQIGFQPTEALKVDETTANVKILTTFAEKLGELVEWRRLTLEGERDVYALIFPASKWQIDAAGELIPVRSVGNDK